MGERGPIVTIVSGGQTGVDRAALDAAMEGGVPVGGWCPKGRRAADGPIAARYPLHETPTAEYAERTAWNVRDSDGTLVFTDGPANGGTALTIEEARRQGKPWLRLDLGEDGSSVEEVVAWMAENGVRTLNVAGPRAAEVPGIYAKTHAFMTRLVARLASARR